MYFYVDESGHTGPNLFDHDQPFLFYGTLCSRVNLDVLAEPFLVKTRKRLGVDRLHANEIGNAGLSEIAPDLVRMQKKFDLRFDFYRVQKIDHAAICFFDQVFDQGMNPAVPWASYWTPLRYMLLVRLAMLFDEELLKGAWAARITPNNAKAEEILRQVCEELIRRSPNLPDARTREIVTDALKWTIENTSKISYNVRSKSDAVSVMPNAIGFQSVMMGIAQRLLNSSRKSLEIVVDRQSQFNKAQARTADWYARLSEQNLANGPGLPALDFRGMPQTEIRFSSGTESAGLELVDVYLWIFKRMFEDKELAPESAPLIKRQIKVGRTDEISLNAVVNRWEPKFKEIMEMEMSEDQLTAAREILEIQETRREKPRRE